ncbi:hypothetical protein F4776DRAFT_595184 [Hypoxylon sp. NC0597]|nr:hypothetical protein F4776DRAFT_595184 [Hypoxylon sp. NC0597]
MERTTLDAVLRGVQLAQGPWTYLMKCDRCQSRDNHKEVFSSVCCKRSHSSLLIPGTECKLSWS